MKAMREMSGEQDAMKDITISCESQCGYGQSREIAIWDKPEDRRDRELLYSLKNWYRFGYCGPLPAEASGWMGP